MPQATDPIACSTYTALDFDGDIIAADDRLSVVLDLLRKLHDPENPEEACVWRNAETIAAVARADGSIHVFEELAQPATPAASNGNGERPKRRRK